MFTGFAASELIFEGRRSSGCAPATAASTSTASGSRPTSQASTFARRSRSSHRWRTRQSDQIAGPATGPRRRTQPAALCDRHQGIVGVAGGSHPGRQRHSHDGLSAEAWTNSAAAFIYAMPDGMVSVGFVSGLDYRDPMFDPHIAFQHFKRHPLVAPLLQGGQMVRYGAKALPEGGWHTIPRVYADGVLIAGDAGGFPELDATEGNPPGDADRHAGRRDRVRGGRARRHVRRRAGGVPGRGSRRARCGASCIPCGTFTRFRLRPARGRGVFRAVAPHASAGGSGIRCLRTPAMSGWRSSPTTIRMRRPIPIRR